MLKKALQKILPNPLDRLLEKAQKQGKKRALLLWNRGLGDIPLGLYALVHRIQSFLPDAEISFLTRPDLLEGFSLLPTVKAYSAASLVRNEKADLALAAKEAKLALEDFEIVIEKPDPTYWVRWQIGKLQPKLKWQEQWDCFAHTKILPERSSCIAVHVHSETRYGYEKNWPSSQWSALFTELEKRKYTCLLFGKKAQEDFPHKNLIDLRGKTSLLELLSLVKNSCCYFIGPDSGILSLLYYLDTSFDLTALSLWADPHQGILKQNVASPNPLLKHIPLIAQNGDLSTLAIHSLLQHL